MTENFFVGPIGQSPIDKSDPAPSAILQSLIVESHHRPDHTRPIGILLEDAELETPAPTGIAGPGKVSTKPVLKKVASKKIPSKKVIAVKIPVKKTVRKITRSR